jgi:hypothetical protein
LIAVVSDGAGSSRWSDRGSQFACDFFVSEIADWLATGVVREITNNLFGSWLRQFNTCIDEKALLEGGRARDFACTLLVAIIGEHHASYFQIGDGAMVVSSREAPEVYDLVFMPQRGEYANTTFFATDPISGAEAYFEAVTAEIDEIALFTDGIQSLVIHYATETAHGPFFLQNFKAVRLASFTGEATELSAALTAYLNSESVNLRTDDDKTLVLATRRTGIR